MRRLELRVSGQDSEDWGGPGETGGADKGGGFVVLCGMSERATILLLHLSSRQPRVGFRMGSSFIPQIKGATASHQRDNLVTLPCVHECTCI